MKLIKQIPSPTLPNAFNMQSGSPLLAGLF